MKLDDEDLGLLALLGTDTRTVTELASLFDAPPDRVGAQLAAMADNGLVVDRGNGRYARTESGRRVLVAQATGAVDERVDTTPDVEAALEECALAPDEADAVRHAFALLRYWGRLTPEEIADAVYSEAPAGRPSSDEWWDGLVRDPLGALPGVKPPTDGDDEWRYVGRPEADDPHTDGRRVLSSLHPVYGDVKHALESIDLGAAEREAARAAFGTLYRRGHATEAELAEAVYPVRSAGYETAEAWLDGVLRPTFEALPGVERADGSAWRYRRPRTHG